MGRFYRTSKLPLIDTTYHEPLDYLLKGVTLDTTYRDATVQAADAQNKALKEIKHLNLDPENKLLEQTIDPYQERIDELANMAYTSSDYGEMNKGVRSLSNDIYDDMQTGQLSQIIDRYNTVANWQKNNAELLKTDPDTYNRLYALQIGQMEQGIASDPNFKMSWENGIATPDFQKQFIDVANKLIPDANVRVDGNGYIISDKNLSPERLMSVWQAIWNDPETRRWAIQQDKIGTPGLISRDANGNPIGFVSPFVNVYNGEPISMEEIAQLSNEEKEKVGRAVNPQWYLAELAGHYTAAEAYNQRDLKVDPVWQTRFLEAGRNSRAAQQERGKWNRFLMGREDKKKQESDTKFTINPYTHLQRTYDSASNDVNGLARYNRAQAGQQFIENTLMQSNDTKRAIDLAWRANKDKYETLEKFKKYLADSEDGPLKTLDYLLNEDKKTRIYINKHYGNYGVIKDAKGSVRKKSLSRELDRTFEQVQNQYRYQDIPATKIETDSGSYNLLKDYILQQGGSQTTQGGAKVNVKVQSNAGEQVRFVDANTAQNLEDEFFNTYKDGSSLEYINNGTVHYFAMNYTRDGANGPETVTIYQDITDNEGIENLFKAIAKNGNGSELLNALHEGEDFADFTRLTSYGNIGNNNSFVTYDDADMIAESPELKAAKVSGDNIESVYYHGARIEQELDDNGNPKENAHRMMTISMDVNTKDGDIHTLHKTIDFDAASNMITGGTEEAKIQYLEKLLGQELVNPDSGVFSNSALAGTEIKDKKSK